MKAKAARLSGAFTITTTLFFAWGFITSNNDPLIATLKASFRLSYTEALMTQLVSFAAFGVMSIPAAMIVSRIGSVRAILSALTTMIAGCLLIQLAARFNVYEPILAALFVLGLWITMLQVAANPLVAALGPPERSHFRLTFAQAFNSLGVVLGVNFGARMMLGSLPATIGSGPAIDSSHRAAALSSVANAFLMIAVMLAVLMAFIWLFRDRITSETANADVGLSGSIGAALRCRWAIAGAIAIGLYVGAEVSIGSIMINFLSQPVILDIPLESAGFYLANIYWMGALVGRFIGSYLLTRIPAPRLLMIAAAAAVLLCLTVVAATGPVAGWAALAVGLCNAIMFPTIFTITLERAKVSQPATSGLLCLAIVGGAIVPYTVGRLADLASLSLAFALPLCSYIYITSFAIGAQAGKQHTRW